MVRLHGDIEERKAGQIAGQNAGRKAGQKARAFAAVYKLVRKIPRGRVMTYGQISVALGSGLSPRAVGWAMHGCPKDVPWQRVVNASGGLSTERMPDVPPGLQRALLEAEGVEFRANGTLDLDEYRYVPRTRRPAPKTRRT